MSEAAESNEFFYVGEDGRKQDAALHEALLANPEAEDSFARATIKDAVARGMQLGEALAAYATDRILAERGLPPRER